MKQRMVTLVLAAGCAVLAAAAFFVYVGQDKKPPEIQVEEEEITYTEGDTYDVLMEGVSAADDADGDLTDEVFIDRIIPIGDGRAVVYYGVMDSSRNVGAASRKVAYIAKDPDGSEWETADGQEDSGQGEWLAEETASEELPGEEELVPDGANPVMALTAAEATVKAGEAFDPLSVVKSVADDVDDADTLYQHIHAEGEYNTGVPGIYEIRYYVSDSDGNTSEAQIFTLTVE